MVRRDELNPGLQYRIPDGARLSTQYIQDLINNKAKSYGISVSFRSDTIADNTMANLLGLFKTECIVLYRSESGPKSIGFAMVLRTEGTYLFINLFKSVYCYDYWGTIVEDIFRELFS